MIARDATQLVVRQQPAQAQVVPKKNPENRKPIDPPPIIELKYDCRNDPYNSQWLVSPGLFMAVQLVSTKKDETIDDEPLIGQTVSALYHLKDDNDKDGGFFVFGDISARKIGLYRLRFSLFDRDQDTDQVMFIESVDSDPFKVVPHVDLPGTPESTDLTRTFSKQGVKLRVRNSRAVSGKAQKRDYNASPAETTSPIYGGAYNSSQLYQGLSISENSGFGAIQQQQYTEWDQVLDWNPDEFLSLISPSNSNS